MKKKNKILRFEEYIAEKVDEFVTATMTEEEFIEQIDRRKGEGMVVNDDVLLTKARKDGFKGDLKPVRSKKTGRTVLIYRPSINIKSTLAVPESKVNEDVHGDAEDVIFSYVKNPSQTAEILDKIEPLLDDARDGDYDMEKVKAILIEYMDEDKAEDLKNDLESGAFYMISMGNEED